MNKPILISIIVATIVVIIIALVVTIIVLATSSDNNNGVLNVKKYKYVETTDSANNFSCSQHVVNSNVKKDLYCIVPKDKALQICQSLPNCGGYAETTNAGWNKMFPNSVSLFDNKFKSGTASPEWKAYKQIYE